MREISCLLSLVTLEATLISCQDKLATLEPTINGVGTIITATAPTSYNPSKTSLNELEFTWVEGDVLGYWYW